MAIYQLGVNNFKFLKQGSGVYTASITPDPNVWVQYSQIQGSSSGTKSLKIYENVQSGVGQITSRIALQVQDPANPNQPLTLQRNKTYIFTFHFYIPNSAPLFNNFLVQFFLFAQRSQAYPNLSSAEWWVGPAVSSSEPFPDGYRIYFTYTTGLYFIIQKKSGGNITNLYVGYGYWEYFHRVSLFITPTTIKLHYQAFPGQQVSLPPVSEWSTATINDSTFTTGEVFFGWGLVQGYTGERAVWMDYFWFEERYSA